MQLLVLSSLALAGCDVHELPDAPERAELRLRLEFDTYMGEQDWEITRSNAYGNTPTRYLDTHDMRYIIRAYPLNSEGTVGDHYEQYSYYRPIYRIGENYDMESTIALPEGSYRLIAWADFVDRNSTENLYYDPKAFNKIVLHGNHKPNTDYRDAFQGTADTTLVIDIIESTADTLVIPMKRPLAKYTFVTSDLQEFIDKETRLMAVRGEIIDSTRANFVIAEDSTRVNTRGLQLEDYKVVISYPMYMPSTYNIFSDIAAGAFNNVRYESQLTVLNNDEARMAFDYVIVNDIPDAKVTVSVELYDKYGNQLSKSEQFNIPLQRSMNTIVRGKFLMLNAQGGVSIDPSFTNDHNIKIE